MIPFNMNLLLNSNQVNIFFGELNYQTISQIKAYDFASLLGDIGGQMGLFIGIVLIILMLMINYSQYSIDFTHSQYTLAY